MTLEEIDIKLEAWQNDIAKLHTNISEVLALIGYRFAHSGRELSGISQSKFKKAVDAEARLWTMVDKFTRHADAIKDKRDKLPTFGRGKVLDEIEQLFVGDVIELPIEDTAADKRDLFTANGGTRKVSADKLRQLMTHDYQLMRDTYLALGQAWITVGENISAAKLQVDGICNEAQRFKREKSAAITALSARLESTSKRLRKDPLGVSTDIKADLAPYFKAANSLLITLSRERAKISEDIGLAGEKLGQLRLRKNKALELHQGCVNEVNAKSEPKVPPSTRGLSDWLAKLQAMVADENWDDAQYGIKEWLGLYGRINRDTEAAVTFNQALLNKRADLKQRFLAAVAAYREYGSRGMQIPKSLLSFTEKGKELLKGKVDLDAAESIVIALEVKLGEVCSRFDK